MSDRSAAYPRRQQDCASANMHCHEEKESQRSRQYENLAEAVEKVEEYDETKTDSSATSISHTVAEKCRSPLERHRPTIKQLLAFIALCLSIFLVALDTVLIPTALPTITSSFHIPDALYAWTGSAYLLANAGSIPLWGKLSDIFGRKPVLLVANIIFLAGSILGAVSLDATMLIAGRTVQGLGGGGVVVLVHVCVSDMFAIR